MNRQENSMNSSCLDIFVSSNKLVWAMDGMIKPTEFQNEKIEQMLLFGSQNSPYHDRTLAEHTRDVILGVPENNLILRRAAFFHDIGKPDSVVIKENTNRMMFPKHAIKSAEITTNIMHEMGYSNEDIDKTVFFVENHDIFMPIHSNDPEVIKKTESLVNLLINKGKEVHLNSSQIKGIFCLMRADINAQAPEAHITFRGVEKIITKKERLEIPTIAEKIFDDKRKKMENEIGVDR